MGNLIKEKLLFAGAIFWVLTFSITLTLILAIPLFYLFIPLEHLDSLSNLTRAALIHNFNQLMNYLLNPFVGQLKMTDFPSSKDGLQHFREVKHLFLFVIAVFILTTPIFVHFVQKRLHLIYRRGILAAMLVPIFMGIIASLIGFDNFFIGFHEVLFRDNTWLFDPTTDPIINVLPENYFMWTMIMFVIIYEIVWLILYLRSMFGFNEQKKKILSK